MLGDNKMIKKESFFLSSINGVKLDKYQVRAVKSKRKNILVLAPAGSGKTLMIVAKIRYLTDVLKVNPKRILCLSFTNKAVNKLKEDTQRNVDVYTFHKLALSIIKSKNEVLTEDIIYDVVLNSYKNEVLLGVYSLNKNQMVSLVSNFIRLFKALGFELNDFYKMIKDANYSDRKLLKEIMKCYVCYEAYLKKENLIDFNDMINMAVKELDSSCPKYDYIIIDEYQDVSTSKVMMVKKIQKYNNAKVFAVGDDFQSIYRFTGSDLNVIINFDDYFPFSRTFLLRNTYRNSIELIRVANKFIMKNKKQIRKKIKSNMSVPNPVVIVFYDDLNTAIKEVIEEFRVDEVFVLGRNNSDLKGVKINVKNSKMTVHKAKGLQSKYVFVLGLKDDKNGFPNKIMNHEILKYLNVNKNKNNYDEERRLFYVALTRCVKKVFLFAPSKNPSIFVKELCTWYKNVVIVKK